MRNCSFILTLLIVSMSMNKGLAQNTIDREFTSAIKEAKTRIQSISCQFEQTVVMSVLSDKEKSSGNFYFRTPGQLKWEQLTPDNYTLVINGDQSYKMDGEEKKSLPVGALQLVGFRRFIMGTLDGSIFDSDHFDTDIAKAELNWEISMLPVKKALSKRFDKIQLTFDQKEMLLQQMTFFELGGDQRIIRFKNHEINTLTDDTNFQ